MYLIETQVGKFKYWIKITYQGARFPQFHFVGIRDNASEFSTEKSAMDTILLIQPKTDNHLVVVNKNQ